jgi:hypothetical protein
MELKDEFNISVTTEDLPASEWPQLSMSTFERAACGDDEPDISHIAVREPNLEYTLGPKLALQYLDRLKSSLK